MGVDGIGEVGDRASEGQAAGVYGAGFTAGSLAGKGARGGIRGTGDKISIDKEFMEVGRVVEGDRSCYKFFINLILKLSRRCNPTIFT